MNLLIVDDEPHIVDWLYELLGAEMPEWTLFRAYSGVQAVKVLEANRIDLLMTDIRMPKMTGIRLMELVRERWPECRILFLTGYGEFDYVYAAIRQPGVRYLLKAEDDAVILQTVREMAAELAGTERFLQERAERLIRRERALNALLRSGAPDERTAETLEFRPGARLTLIRVRAAGTPSGLEAERLAEDALTCCRNPIEMDGADGESFWLGETVDEQSEWDCAQRLYTALRQRAGGAVQADLLRGGATLAQLAERMEKMRRQGGEARDGVSVLDVSERRDRRREMDLQRRLLAVQSMEFLLQRGEREAYLRAMDEAVSGLRDGEDCRRLYLALALQLTAYIERAGGAERMPGGLGLERLRAPGRFSDWNEAFALCRAAAEALPMGREDGAEGGVARRVADYIDGHLSEELSLTMLAEKWHYNPSYLSRTFKQQMGVNLNAYIAQTRMRRACELLDGTDARVGEIARQLGFRNAQYFSNVFRKHMGMIPQEYRARKSK